ncbi:MAG: hypothetical protein U0903_19415 [Planctomycetales bacterium]
MNQAWINAVDQVVSELLDRLQILAPPIDSLWVARKLGIQLVTDESQIGRGRCKRLGDRATFFIRPEKRLERLQWAVAHELGECFAWRVARSSGQDLDAGEGVTREAVANKFASRLLLPSRWFVTDAERCAGDLLTLKEIYRTASHESIAWRLLDLDQPTIITICDQGKITARKGNEFSPPRVLHPHEKHMWRESHERNCSVEWEQSELKIQCWPIHEPDWKREVLRTTCRWEPDFAMDSAVADRLRPFRVAEQEDSWE